jgi:hypothetical protein
MELEYIKRPLRRIRQAIPDASPALSQVEGAKSSLEVVE